MNLDDALALRVSLDGVQAVVAGLQAIADSLQSAAGYANLYAAAGAAVAATGIAIAVSSIPAYENFEKMRRSFVALTDESEGNHLANWLNEFGIQANASSDALRRAGTMWLGYTNEAKGVEPLIRGLEKLSTAAGVNSEELVNAARAIAQIRASGTFKAQEFNQLVNAQVPVNLVAKKLGVATLKDALGMDSKVVTQAITDVLNELPDQPPLILQSIQNGIEGIQKALQPTGRLFSIALTPIVAIGGAAITIFDKLNQYTFGFAGALLSVSLAIGGFNAMLPILTQTWEVASKIFAVDNIKSFVSFLPKIVTFLKDMFTIEKALLALEKVRAGWAAIMAALSGNWKNLAAAAVVAAGVGVAWYVNDQAEKRKEEEEAAAKPAEGSGSPANRPYSRSAVENLYGRQYAAMAGV